jgi:tetratricopeptide (TPR) repeat protein
MKRFDHKESLIQAMKSGLNLFVGAGFSLYAKDAEGNNLPKGSDLVEELHKSVGPGLNDLAKYCTVMERKNRAALYSFLTHRFTVSSYEEFYLNLNYINLKGVYTTNIDDLIPNIVARNKYRYINEQSVNGDCIDERGINYLPLHGYVKYPDQGYVFSVERIAHIYNQAPRIWAYLSSAVEKYPTLFIGYGMNDTGVIEAVLSQPTFNNVQKSKWIILCDPSKEDIEYFEGIGFSIIISETREFLEEIPRLDKWDSLRLKRSPLEDLLKGYVIPRDGRGFIQRPITDFYRGMAPTWPDIQRNVIYKTSFFKDIENSVYHPSRHTIVIGTPISGKTTLAMQVGYFIQYEGIKLVFDNMTYNRAEYIAKLVGSERAFMIVENFTDDIDAFLLLSSLPNVKVLGIDLSHNYATINHLIDAGRFEVINVTELKDQDVQGIIDAIPDEIRRNEKRKWKSRQYSSDSIYEFVLRHVQGPSIETRYKGFVKNLEKQNRDLIEFLVLCAYMNYSRVPMSMEVAYEYFDKLHYSEVIDMRKQLADFLKEDDDEWLAEQNIDGYRPRSSIISQSILKYTDREILADVMWNVVDRVHSFAICNFKTFRKWAFDKTLALKAFANWREGMDFYEQVFIYDNNNPYILQQGALYLSTKHRYREAFDWIDRAKTMTNNKHFSIRNSHAIILFDANYEINTTEAKGLLIKSMETLHECYTNDNRKTYHAQVYADQALRFFKKYHDNTSVEFLEQSKVWLNDELKGKPWVNELKPLLKRVENTLSYHDS